MSEDIEVKVKAVRIADALLLIAKANHYLVGFNGGATLDELEQAKQILIVWSSNTNDRDADLNLALDLIEREIKGAKL
jgi:hypothetical protein